MVGILEKAPAFRAKAVVGKGEVVDVSLADYRGKWVVLFFYPLDFTTVCPTEIVEFSRRHREFEALDAQVLACSVDSQHSHRAWIQKDLKEVTFPLVADLTKEIARSFGALIEGQGFATRATYIIDPEGVVQYAAYHNTRVGRSVSETLRVLEALRTGEKCPAEWNKGQKTLGK